MLLPVAILLMLALAARRASEPADAPPLPPGAEVSSFDLDAFCAGRSAGPSRNAAEFLACNPILPREQRIAAYADWEMARLERQADADWWDSVDVFVADKVGGAVEAYVVPAGLAALAATFPAAAPAIAAGYAAYQDNGL